MKLSNKALEDFKKIYRKQFKVHITSEKANELGLELLEFFRLIYKPVQKDFIKNS